MRILFIGEVVGRPGRQALRRNLPVLKRDLEPEFIIANGENAAGGAGITPKVLNELFEMGIDVVTGGNHIWHNREVMGVIDHEPRLLRPANYPSGQCVPGRGASVYQSGRNFSVGVVNLIGRVFMGTFECPFRVAEHEVANLRHHTPIIIIDFHAEATSEKVALGWYLDGQVSAVIGTHTHIPTADERILPKGTAYITDVGMTGPYNSVIGVEKEPVIQRFLTQLPVRHEVAKGDVRIAALMVDVDPLTGKAVSVERIFRPVES